MSTRVQVRQAHAGTVRRRRVWTPIGVVELASVDAGLCALEFVDGTAAPDPGASDTILDEAERELRAYFAGELRRFDVPLSPAGTTFQSRVWEALRRVPYGRTATYTDVAAEIGAPKATRAVGLANGSNPIAIVIPCHRVVGRSGQLVGYGGGLDRKRWLLEHESGGLFDAPA